MSRKPGLFRDAFFRSARPMADGRMLVRYRSVFYIMTTGQLRFVRWWNAAMIVAALSYLGVVVNDYYLMFHDGILRFSVHTMPAFFILAGFIAANFVVDRRMRRWRQPESEFDQQLETWDRIG